MTTLKKLLDILETLYYYKTTPELAVLKRGDEIIKFFIDTDYNLDPCPTCMYFQNSSKVPIFFYPNDMKYVKKYGVGPKDKDWKIESGTLDCIRNCIARLNRLENDLTKIEVENE